MNSILNEYGVLGSLLIDPSLFPEAAELPDDMFSSVPLQEIFRAMRHQYEESGSFDALTVRVEAGRNCTDVTDKLIAGLMDTTPTTANLDVYLAAVKEAALARSLRKIGEELMTAEHDPIVTPGVGTVVGMGLGLILGLSIYSVRKDPKKGTQRLVSIGRSVLLGLLAGVLGVGLAALGIVSAGTAFIISAAIGLALKFFVDSVDDSKVRKATSGFTGTRVSTKTPTRSRRVAAQNLDGNAPVYNEIPALASGAVIPPNRKFLAVLGDQKSGTNVEAPLSTIKQAVMEAMAQGSREPINVNLVVDGKTLARVVVPNINNMTRAAGKPVLLY